MLINSDRKLDPDVPSPSQFDHVITMVPLEKRESGWIRPPRLRLSGCSPSICARKTPWWFRPKGSPPRGDAGRHSYAQQAIAGNRWQGERTRKLTASVKFTVRGDPELLMRIIFRRIPNAQWKRLVETINTAGGLAGGEISELNVSDPGATKEPFHFEYTVNKTNFFDWSKKKSDLELPLSQVGLPDAPDDDVSDKTPVKLGPPGEFTYRARIEFAPQVFHRAFPFPFQHEARLWRIPGQLQDGRPHVHRGTQTADARARTSRRPRRRIHGISARRAFRPWTAVSIENTSAGRPTPPANMKADELNESGRSAMQNGNFPLAIRVVPAAPWKLEPKDKYAWNNLGLAYLAMRDTTKAVEAFQKQLEVNPYDEFAYNNLGRAYWQDRKYDEAANAFKKQIEINPLDNFAHSNLGAMYAEWHKYDEAAPELEKAVSLRPEDPDAASQSRAMHT